MSGRIVDKMPVSPDLGTLSLLPREVRDRIYTHSLYIDPADKDRRYGFLRPSKLALLRASRRIHDEAVICYYRANTWALWIGLDSCEENVSIMNSPGFMLTFSHYSQPCEPESKDDKCCIRLSKDALRHVQKIDVVIGQGDPVGEHDIVPTWEQTILGPERRTFRPVVAMAEEALALLRQCNKIRSLRVTVHGSDDDPGSIYEVLEPFTRLREVRWSWCCVSQGYALYSLRRSYSRYLQRLMALPEGAVLPPYTPDPTDQGTEKSSIFLIREIPGDEDDEYDEYDGYDEDYQVDEDLYDMYPDEYYDEIDQLYHGRLDDDVLEEMMAEHMAHPRIPTNAVPPTPSTEQSARGAAHTMEEVQRAYAAYLNAQAAGEPSIGPPLAMMQAAFEMAMTSSADLARMESMPMDARLAELGRQPPSASAASQPASGSTTSGASSQSPTPAEKRDGLDARIAALEAELASSYAENARRESARAAGLAEGQVPRSMPPPSRDAQAGTAQSASGSNGPTFQGRPAPQFAQPTPQAPRVFGPERPPHLAQPPTTQSTGSAPPPWPPHPDIIGPLPSELPDDASYFETGFGGPHFDNVQSLHPDAIRHYINAMRPQ